MDFKTYLWDNEIRNTTNLKYLRMFNKFLNWATERDYNSNLSYKKFKFKFKGVEIENYQNNIIFFIWKELQHLNNFDFSKNKKLEQVRDIYCFCCYISLRYSDIARLKKHDIKSDSKGNYKTMELYTKIVDEEKKMSMDKFNSI